MNGTGNDCVSDEKASAASDPFTLKKPPSVVFLLYKKTHKGTNHQAARERIKRGKGAIK
jgi:hypothetical protein